MNQKPKMNNPIFSYKALVTIVVLIVVVCGFITYDFVISSRSFQLTQVDPQRTVGGAKAEVKVIEFLDFTCFECAIGHALLKNYLERFPTQLSVSAKYFPQTELNSTISAVYAECAAQQNKFWEFHDALFEHQEEWRTLLKIKPYFKKTAEDLKLDISKLDQCVSSKSVENIVKKEKSVGEKNKVQVTPTYFVNGERVVGVLSLERILSQILKEGK